MKIRSCSRRVICFVAGATQTSLKSWIPCPLIFGDNVLIETAICEKSQWCQTNMVSSSRSYNQGSPVIHGQLTEKATTRTVPIHDHLLWGRARNWSVVRNPIIRSVTAMWERNNAFPWTNQIITHAQLSAWGVKCPPFLFFVSHGHVNLCLHRLTQMSVRFALAYEKLEGWFTWYKSSHVIAVIWIRYLLQKFHAYVN